MENFILYNPTRLHFGKNVTSRLGKSVAAYGNKVLLVYGGGSIKKNGIYELVMAQLNQVHAQVYEYSGIRPNPVIKDVDAAASLGRIKEVDVILAVGGGSVIDSAKIISITIPAGHSGWKFMMGAAKPITAVPLIAVLTLAATGTEMNRFAVVQNNRVKEKIGFGHHLLYPKESFLDPSMTISVPRDYTAYGIVDLVAHCLEGYFGEGEATLSDRFIYAILNEAMEFGVPLLDDPGNYSLREKIMYAATNALNNLTFYGRKTGDWGVHSVGHVISLLYDTPHGATLSIAYPAWLKLHREKTAGRITELGKNLFNVETVDETIRRIESFFRSLDSPVRLQDVGIEGEENKNKIVKVLASTRADGNHHKLSGDDYKKLVELMAGKP
jgi:alcohol dehydrogenase YqhD (iron-dependent ADH family)